LRAKVKRAFRAISRTYTASRFPLGAAQALSARPFAQTALPTTALSSPTFLFVPPSLPTCRGRIHGSGAGMSEPSAQGSPTTTSTLTEPTAGQFKLGPVAALSAVGGLTVEQTAVLSGAAAASAVGGFNAEATTLRPTNPLTIRPTIYPTPPGDTVTVEDPVVIDLNGALFRDFATKMDRLIEAAQKSNEIAGEVRDKLIAEWKSGREYIAGPKPSRKVLDLLLVNPLVWAALGFAGTFVGEAAKLAFKALLKLISPDLDIPL
jgi:hypothetical protein